jgi:UDP-glucose 4-epimerase
MLSTRSIREAPTHMKILVTGSAGHLGEALVRVLRTTPHDVVGLDLAESPWTDCVGSIVERGFVRACMRGCDAVLHTATLHKPHAVTHSKQAFIDTNVTGTLTLLEAAVELGVSRFVFTSSTSVFGAALRPPAGSPAAWITEDVPALPKNIYGITKLAAENLCRLFHRKHGLMGAVLRTSRFFPEEDDDPVTRREYESANAQVNELLFRRVDLEDAVSAHLLACENAAALGFDTFVVSATSPFAPDDALELRENAPAVVERRVPRYRDCYERLGWRMFPGVDRVYVNGKLRDAVGWQPTWSFAHAVDRLLAGADPRSRLAREVGTKGYHAEVFEDGPYPVE